MSATRLAFEATYMTGSGQNSYRYTIAVDSQDRVSVRDIRSPFGLIMDSMTSLPQAVVADINAAIAQVESLMALSSPINGNLVFSGETEKVVSFAAPVSNTNYRVHLSPSDFVPVRVINKLVTGFTVQVGITYTGIVGYDVVL